MVTLLRLMLLIYSSALFARDNPGFHYAPKVCVSEEARCQLQLELNWHSSSPLCLYLSLSPQQPVICDDQLKNFLLTVEFEGQLELELRQQSDGTLTSTGQVKVLQLDPANSGLHKRRPSWGIF